MAPEAETEAAPTGEDELFALPLEEFTAARNALAKERARQGDGEASRRIKSLVKPTRTAWALNQLARRRPDDVERLLEAGAGVRRAQYRALEGDPSQLRPAAAVEEERLDVVLQAAVGLLGGNPASQVASRERMRKTLRAAATDPSTGSLLRQGRLVTDVEVSGFGLDDLGELPEQARPGPSGPDDDQEQRREAQRLSRDAERLRQDAERARQRARRLSDEAARAEQQALDARHEAERAVEVATEAERAADEAAARADAASIGNARRS